MPILLTRKDVESVLTMGDAIEAVEEGLGRLARGNVLMPQRTAIRVAEHKGLHLGMPAYVGGEGAGALALKVVTVYPDNPQSYGLPTTIGTLLLNDPRTGRLLAIMDAGYLTAVRTGAISGVATRYLALPGARRLGVFGAGAMARMQLRAIAEVRTLTEVRLFDPNFEIRDRFIREMGAELSIEIRPAATPRECASCEIVVAATSSKTPIFDGKDLQPGAHVNGIGAHSPDAREIDAAAIRRCKVVADHIPACMAEAGDLLLAIEEGAFRPEAIHASLGEVVAGLKAGRQSEAEITLFKSVGLAVQDAVTAARVYERALAAGVGREVEI